MSNWKLASANARFGTLTSVTIAQPGAADTWTAWTDFDATTPRNVQGIAIFRRSPLESGRWRVELGFDSGNAVVVSGGLPFAGTGTVFANSQSSGMAILPLALPAGVTPSARVQASGTATTNVILSMYYIVGTWLWPIAPLSLIDVQGWVTGVNGTNCAANTNTSIATTSSTRQVRAVNIASLGANTGSGSNVIMNVSLDTGTSNYITERRNSINNTGTITQDPSYSYVDHMIPCNVAKSTTLYARTSVARSVVLALGY